MERLALIGVSHRRGGAKALEAWQREFNPEDLAGLCGYVLDEWVPLVTCNRWDLVLRLPSGLSLDEARARLTPSGETVRPYAYTGEGALEHLCRVAASLDSLNPGEDQIMAQVRTAFAEAKRQGTVGSTTSFAFHTALRIAKRVRRDIALAPLHTSLFSLALPTLAPFLQPEAKVAVLGAGQMGTLAAKALHSYPSELIIVNRSVARAQHLAQQLRADSMSLNDFLAAPPDIDVLVCGLPIKEIVDEALLAELPHVKVIVDLGIPRNVAPGAAAAPGVTLLNVDTLQAAGTSRRSELSAKLAEAEQLVQEELERALSEWTERQLGPSIKQLKSWYLDTIGDSLPKEEAAKLAHKFAHVPIKGLRALAREYGLDAAKVFLAETGLE